MLKKKSSLKIKFLFIFGKMCVKSLSIKIAFQAFNSLKTKSPADLSKFLLRMRSPTSNDLRLHTRGGIKHTLRELNFRLS